MLGIPILAARWAQAYQVSAAMAEAAGNGMHRARPDASRRVQGGAVDSGLTVRAYIESRDPVSGAAYFVALGVFALIPLFGGRPRA
ncbi:MAG TPA: hypothetical protein VG206_08320 [Terriglobia bacterium]|nr:hypothetical protein [Terriglobia bacterium]